MAEDTSGKHSQCSRKLHRRQNNENFDWVAYIASRPNAEEILESPIIDFRAEVFPELDPNRDKMPRNPYRVDLLCIRENGSGVRLHPHKHGKEEIHIGDLKAWRAGLRKDTQVRNERVRENTSPFIEDSPSELDDAEIIFGPITAEDQGKFFVKFTQKDPKASDTPSVERHTDGEDNLSKQSYGIISKDTPSYLLKYYAAPGPPSSSTTEASLTCPECQHSCGEQAKFCEECGLQVRPYYQKCAWRRRHPYNQQYEKPQDASKQQDWMASKSSWNW